MTTRRTFLQQSAGLALAAQLPCDAIAQASIEERNKQVVMGYKAAAKTRCASTPSPPRGCCATNNSTSAT